MSGIEDVPTGYRDGNSSNPGEVFRGSASVLPGLAYLITAFVLSFWISILREVEMIVGYGKGFKGMLGLYRLAGFRGFCRL